jgi:D-threo-aldose 1-dehydrogenase
MTASCGPGRVALPRIGLGCAMLGRTDGGLDDPAAAAAIRHAAARGIGWFDTAPLYGATLSETRLGAALRLIAPRPLVSTKVGFDFTATPGQVVTAGARRRDQSAAFTRRSIADSLARLGLARLDLVFVHDPVDLADEAASGSVAVLEEMRADGLVGAIGVGVNDIEVARELLARVRLDAVLLAGRYTLLDWSGAGFLRECRRAGIAAIAAAPMASGILATGARTPGTYRYAKAPPHVVARVAAIEARCARHDVPLRAAALRFAAANPDIASLLLGAGTRTEIDDTFACLATPIPQALWDDLVDAGLLAPDLHLPPEIPPPRSARDDRTDETARVVALENGGAA